MELSHSIARYKALNRSLLFLKSRKKIDQTLESQMNSLEVRIKNNDQIKLERLRLSQEYLYQVNVTNINGNEYMIHSLKGRIKCLSILKDDLYEPVLFIDQATFNKLQSV